MAPSTPSIPPPTIHLNGTPAADLLAQWENAYTALVDALARLREVEVHGRDYPQGIDAARQARDGWEAHYTAIAGVTSDVGRVLSHLRADARGVHADPTR